MLAVAAMTTHLESAGCVGLHRLAYIAHEASGTPADLAATNDE